MSVASSIGRSGASLALSLAALLLAAPPVSAETLEGALGRAYAAHPSLNATRAGVRATDENVPQAISGYRPRINASADAGIAYSQVDRNGLTNDQNTLPRGAGLQVDQTLFNGFRTRNRVRSAESGVLAARESLRGTEQTILFTAAQAYMDVLRDTAVLNLRNNNVEVLEEQLRQTTDRFNVGEVTRTDTAQAQARLEGARSQAIAAQATLKASVARYRQAVGVEPRQLAPGRPIDRLLPRSLEAAVSQALAIHPSITSALHNVDFAEFNVAVIQGELYPSVTVSGRLSQRYDSQTTNDRVTSASVVGTLSIPIYEGGEVYARVRQAKETLGQRRLEVDVARDTVRANAIAAWGQMEATRAQITAAQAQVKAAETALAGVREEAKVGQRTTLDVLNAQQELLDARVALITAQRDRVVASYQVLQSTGRLSAASLGLRTAGYDPKVHFDQVRDKPWGLKTPDGR